MNVTPGIIKNSSKSYARRGKGKHSQNMTRKAYLILDNHITHHNKPDASITEVASASPSAEFALAHVQQK